MRRIHEVPAELIAPICSHLDPGSLFNFALSCHIFHQMSKDRLIKQRALGQKYRVIRDCNPINIIIALRLAVTNEDAAWHIRKIERWEIRQNFLGWKRAPSHQGFKNARKGWRDLFPDTDWAEDDFLIYTNLLRKWTDFSHLQSSFYTDEELAIYDRMLETLIIQPHACLQLKRNMRLGHQEALILLLIACAPRINELCITQRQESTEGFPCMSLLQYLRSMPSVETPFMMQSLRRVDLCPFQYHDCQGGFQWSIEAEDIAVFFRLPLLESLRLSQNKSYNWPYSRLYFNWQWEKNGSVKETWMTFTLEPDSSAHRWRQGGLMRGLCNGQLPSPLRSYESQTGASKDIEKLIAYAGDDLEILALYETPVIMDFMINHFQRLHTLVIGIDYFGQSIIECSRGTIAYFPKHPKPFKICNVLPVSLKSLMVHDDWNYHYYHHGIERRGQSIYELASQLFQELRIHVLDSVQPRLSDICIQQMWSDTPPQELSALQSALDAANVNFHLQKSFAPNPSCTLCSKYRWYNCRTFSGGNFRKRLDKWNWATQEYELVDECIVTWDDSDMPLDVPRWRKEMDHERAQYMATFMRLLDEGASEQELLDVEHIDADALFPRLLAKEKTGLLNWTMDVAKRIRPN